VPTPGVIRHRTHRRPAGYAVGARPAVREPAGARLSAPAGQTPRSAYLDRRLGLRLCDRECRRLPHWCNRVTVTDLISSYVF